MLKRLQQDEEARRHRMAWDNLEATVRAENARPVPDRIPVLGEAVAWISRDNGKASNVSAVHHYYEDGRTFCRLAVPGAALHLPILPSLDVCTRCDAMSRRALHYAKLAAEGVIATPMKVSA